MPKGLGTLGSTQVGCLGPRVFVQPLEGGHGKQLWYMSRCVGWHLVTTTPHPMHTTLPTAPTCGPQAGPAAFVHCKDPSQTHTDPSQTHTDPSQTHTFVHCKDPSQTHTTCFRLGSSVSPPIHTSHVSPPPPPPHTHTFPTCRLAQLRLYIEKIRPIDKQLSYQVEKLLRVTAKVQKEATAEAAEAAAAAAAGDEQAAAADGGDALQYRPNPQALISKVPLVGDTTGEGGRGTGLGGGFTGLVVPVALKTATSADTAGSGRAVRK